MILYTFKIIQEYQKYTEHLKSQSVLVKWALSVVSRDNGLYRCFSFLLLDLCSNAKKLKD